MGTITTTSQALLLAFSNALSTFFAFIPHLIGAIIILIIGLVGSLLSSDKAVDGPPGPKPVKERL